MFFKVLKLFGLDVPAKLAEVRTTLEERVELVKDQVTEQAQATAAIAALFGLAGMAMFAAVGVGLAALYDWIALTYGQFYGYAAVVGVLLLLAATAFAGARTKAKSWTAESAGRLAEKQRERAQNRVVRVAAATTALESSFSPSPYPPQSSYSTSAGDLIEPLTLILSKMIRFPTFGNPLLDELVANLRDPVRSVANETVERVAHAVRYGARSQLALSLGSAVLIGWFVGRHQPHDIDG
jgi:hypothetical protein